MKWAEIKARISRNTYTEQSISRVCCSKHLSIFSSPLCFLFQPLHPSSLITAWQTARCVCLRVRRREALRKTWGNKFKPERKKNEHRRERGVKQNKRKMEKRKRDCSRAWRREIKNSCCRRRKQTHRRLDMCVDLSTDVLGFLFSSFRRFIQSDGAFTSSSEGLSVCFLLRVNHFRGRCLQTGSSLARRVHRDVALLWYSHC